jgi:hypothetical protein
MAHKTKQPSALLQGPLWGAMQRPLRYNGPRREGELGIRTMASRDAPIDVHEFDPERLDLALEFLKRTRSELRTLRKVRVSKDSVRIFDVNHAFFEIRGLGYSDQQIIPVLDHVHAAYKRELIHEPTDAEHKEFKTGRRYPWAADRVM